MLFKNKIYFIAQYFLINSELTLLFKILLTFFSFVSPFILFVNFDFLLLSLLFLRLNLLEDVDVQNLGKTFFGIFPFVIFSFSASNVVLFIKRFFIINCFWLFIPIKFLFIVLIFVLLLLLKLLLIWFWLLFEEFRYLFL